MTKTHKKHVAKTTTESPWMGCVNPEQCGSQAPHGNIVKRDECSCGAYRQTEINGRHSRSTGWLPRREP